MTRNIKQDLANYSQQSVRDISVSRLEELYAPIVAQRKAQDEENEREFNLNIPQIEHVKRLLAQQLEQMANEENAHLPVTSTFSALQVVKQAKVSENDIGVRALETMLNNMWRKDRESSISAASYTALVDHFKKNYPKSAVVDVLEEVGSSGYLSLEVSKLAEIASEIQSQEDYERVILENGLQSNAPHCKKARQFILALVNESPETEPEEEDKFENLYQELREKKQRGELPLNFSKKPQGDKIGNARPFERTAQEDSPDEEEEFDSEWGKYDSPLAKDLWEKSMEGMYQDEEMGDVSENGAWYALFKEERAILRQNDQGFIYAEQYDSEEETMEMWKNIAKDLYPEEESEESDEEDLV